MEGGLREGYRDRVAIRLGGLQLVQRRDVRVCRRGVGEEHRNRLPQYVKILAAGWRCEDMVMPPNAAPIDRRHDLCRQPCEFRTMVRAVISGLMLAIHRAHNFRHRCWVADDVERGRM